MVFATGTAVRLPRPGTLLTLLIPVPLYTGCMPAMGDVQFSGVAQPSMVPKDQIQDVILMPPGYESMGEVSIACHESHRTDGLGLLDPIGRCDIDGLVDALKEKASRVGGELLVQRRCESDNDNTTGLDGKPAYDEKMNCRAVVARRCAPGNGGMTYGVPNSQVPPALRGTSTVTTKPTLSPEVTEATTPFEPAPSVAASATPPNTSGGDSP